MSHINKRPWEIISKTPNIKKIGQIPCIIHQTWKNLDVPKEWQISQKGWKEHHPDWIYILWTDEDIFVYISEFHPEFIELFINFPHGIQKADAMRYFVLHDFGGVYSDLDLAPVKNLKEYFDQGMDLYFLFSPNVNAFTNFIMASAPKEKIWRQIWDRLLHPKMPFWAIGKHLEVYYSTGPFMINDVIMCYPKTIGFLPKSVFAPVEISEEYGKYTGGDAGVITLNGRSWNSFDSVIINTCYKHRHMLMIICAILVIFAIYVIAKKVIKKMK
jgi:mannosyltransferase OCH1-like enzyme